jgi:hypothetical protein
MLTMPGRTQVQMAGMHIWGWLPSRLPAHGRVILAEEATCNAMHPGVHRIAPGWFDLVMLAGESSWSCPPISAS